MDPCKNAQMPTGNVFKLFQNMRLIQHTLQPNEKPTTFAKSPRVATIKLITYTLTPYDQN